MVFGQLVGYDVYFLINPFCPPGDDMSPFKLGRKKVSYSIYFGYGDQ